ncbi:MAG TPA: glycerol kinase [Gemmatimonas aurantiaca]|uniref:glycerol kinase n=2 Tax=Gemmatimonas aurantiaca TaxID=173480 RepID=C1A6K0_GEMAT|nr:glycerol kinase GlpK [Gemmatimonas aurantiaca]BAH37860.1 glycerol kinase [Gemmatimonas aurantiaca T-27]HCT56636.1 glycerol kinase [Gemmatimonas aurantiaca]
MTCVLAIDQGTTGTTCLVIAHDGRVIGRAYREITQFYPAPGWVEHDAHEILERTLAAAREAIAEAQLTANMVPAAIGITNQRETIVLWERATGRAVHKAIVWQDRRTAQRCAELAPQAAMIGERTGLVTDPYFSATKLEWLLAQNDHRTRAERGELAAGTIDSWLIWHLSGGTAHVTDHTNASRTMLYDIGSRAWSPELCALFGVPASLLPTIVASSGEVARSTQATLGATIPITGIAGDQQAALFGQGGWAAGDGKNTYGTGAFLLLNTGAYRPAPGSGLLTTIACDERGAPVFALEASIFIAGAAVQWLRDGLGIIETSAETEALARGLASNDGVYFVPALVGLGAPDWEPNARGTIVGLTRGTTRAHMARAALEAMAYATRDVLGSMGSQGGVAFDRLRVDGGASANDWLMQFQSDVLGVPIERPDLVETTALGAAGLAGLAVGIWKDGAEFLASRHFTRFTPDKVGTVSAASAYAGWRRAIRAALGWARDTERDAGTSGR